MSDLYIPRIGQHIFLQQNRQTNRGIKLIAHRHINVEFGTEATQFLFWEYLFTILAIVSLQCICWKVRVRRKNDQKNVPLLSNNGLVGLVWELL